MHRSGLDMQRLSTRHHELVRRSQSSARRVMMCVPDQWRNTDGGRIAHAGVCCCARASEVDDGCTSHPPRHPTEHDVRREDRAQRRRTAQMGCACIIASPSANETLRLARRSRAVPVAQHTARHDWLRRSTIPKVHSTISQTVVLSLRGHFEDIEDMNRYTKI